MDKQWQIYPRREQAPRPRREQAPHPRREPPLYPRTVKAPRPWRENTMEFETVSEDYNVAEFHDNFGHTLPKIVMVNQGFCGEIVQDTFDRQQIMRLHTVSKQKRVIARFTTSGQKKLVSIPLMYEVKMCVLDKKGKHGKEQKLATIVKEHPLPVYVQFPQHKAISIGNQTISSDWIPKLELVQTFDEMYFLANFIIDGVLVGEVTPVPLYLKQLRLVEVTGIKGQEKEKWNSYVEQIGLACSKLHYDLGFGNSEVAVYDPSANYTDTTYSYVEPTIYSPMHSFFKKNTFGNPSYTIPEEPEVQDEIAGIQYKGTGDVYEEIGESRMGAGQSMDTGTQLTSELKQRIGAGHQSNPNTHSIAVSPPVAPKPKPAYVHRTSGGSPRLPARKPTSRGVNESAGLSSNAYSNVATKFVTQASVAMKDSPPPPAPTPPPPPPQTTDASTKISTTEEIKQLKGSEDVAKLSIDELSVYMKALNLGQYVHTFRDQMVDGSLLLDLDKDVLKTDFKMKGIEAIRLEKFARSGHIPQ